MRLPQWTLWSDCDHNCLPYTSTGSEQTRARRRRMRYCLDPPAQHGGAECARDKNYHWVSEENGELDETACITPEDGEEDFTPWCPGMSSKY